MACEFTATCPFFNDRTNVRASTAALFKAKYCKDQYTECARYLVATAHGRENVPPDLGPADRLEALRIMRYSGVG